MGKQIQDKILKYNVVFQLEPEGGYTVIVPSLRGCVTYGETFEEARVMAIDAIQGFVASLEEDNEEIPNDEKSVVSTIDIRSSDFALA